jgi:hypothetical protein
MRTLTIEAASPESASDFCLALSGFNAQSSETEDGKHLVSVKVSSDKQIIELLNTLEAHVSRRGRKAHIDLDGHNYTLHPPSG